MNLTSVFPDLQPQIYARAKPPMLTLITGANHEVIVSLLDLLLELFIRIIIIVFYISIIC
jgi:hypothetical protein